MEEVVGRGGRERNGWGLPVIEAWCSHSRQEEFYQISGGVSLIQQEEDDTTHVPTGHGVCSFNYHAASCTHKQ